MKPNAHTPSTATHPESGNVFIFILLGVALFTSLIFAVSKSMRSQNATQMSEREARLAAADILDTAQKIERGVARVYGRGISESEISFANPIVSGYTHSQPDKNKVFASTGGGISWISPAANVNDGSEWIITGATCIADLGTGATGCDSDSDTSNEELLLILPNVKQVVCSELDRLLKISSIPADTGSSYSTTKYTGSFADGTEINVGSAYKTACYSKSGAYHFYHTLLAR